MTTLHDRHHIRLWDRSDISDATGFDNGDEFTAEEQVREYFTVESYESMFGPDAPVYTQEELDEMASLVIRHRWHCAF